MTFTTFLARLNAGDIEGALACFTPSAAEQYRPVLQALSGELPAVAQQLGVIVDGYMTEELAEYLLVQQQTDGSSQGFLVYLIRMPDGVWRISQL
jgi:hypothetical protein